MRNKLTNSWRANSTQLAITWSSNSQTNWQPVHKQIAINSNDIDWKREINWHTDIRIANNHQLIDQTIDKPIDKQLAHEWQRLAIHWSNNWQTTWQTVDTQNFKQLTIIDQSVYKPIDKELTHELQWINN